MTRYEKSFSKLLTKKHSLKWSFVTEWKISYFTSAIAWMNCLNLLTALCQLQKKTWGNLENVSTDSLFTL